MQMSIGDIVLFLASDSRSTDGKHFEHVCVPETPIALFRYLLNLLTYLRMYLFILDKVEILI